MSGIRLDRAAIGENTLAAPGPTMNPLSVPCLFGDIARRGPQTWAPRTCGLVLIHDVNTLASF